MDVLLIKRRKAANTNIPLIVGAPPNGEPVVPKGTGNSEGTGSTSSRTAGCSAYSCTSVDVELNGWSDNVVRGAGAARTGTRAVYAKERKSTSCGEGLIFVVPGGIDDRKVKDTEVMLE